MRIVAVFIVAAALSAGLPLAEGAAVAEGNPHNSGAFCSATPARNSSIWRMEVQVNEAAYVGPSIRDRFANNWSETAKRTYRWTSATMPVDTGTSTQLMTVSAVVIADGVPVLAKGNVVDVDVVQGLDYSRGKAPIVVRRVCSVRDEGCLDELRKSQKGRVSDVEVGGGYSVAGDRRYLGRSPILAAH